MTRRELFGRYAAQQKRAAPPGFRLDNLRGLTRLTPIEPDFEGVVMFAELAEATVDEAIAVQLAYFAGIGRGFEWKVHDFDTPADLASRLQARGFSPGDAEALMIYKTASAQPRIPNARIRLERITSRAGIRQVVEVQETVWGRSFPWLEASLMAALERTAIYCAYSGEDPVGTGWIGFPEGGDFAELHGGSVLPSSRGQSIYTALFDVRVEEAKRRGVPYLAVDAAPMSRPILLKKGFTHVCETTPFRRRA